MSEALFTIPSNWEPTTLGEVCKRGGGDVQTGPFGSQLHAADYVSKGIPSIMPQNIGENRISEDGIARITDEDAQRLSRYLVRAGDIVYSRRGDVERRALIREREEGWLCGTGCLRVRFGKGVVHPPYAAHYLGHPLVREWIVRHAHGATMPNLNTSILSALPFVLPTLDEQRAIAYILGTLDDKIELNRRMNETLEAIARAMFKSWFVDFDPVRAKMSGEPPESICQRLGLTLDLLALFPGSLVDSELGEMPTGWGVQSFIGGVDIIGGGTPKTSVPEYWGGEIPWFSVVDAPSGSDVWVVDTEKKVTREGIENSSARILPVGTTIISARGTVGKIALVGVPMAMNQSCYGLRGKVGTQGLFNYFDTQRLVVTLQQRTHGSVFDTITRTTLEGVETVVPPSRVVDAFEALIGPCMQVIRSNVFQSCNLSELRDTLLPKLLSGELTLSDSFDIER